MSSSILFTLKALRSEFQSLPAETRKQVAADAQAQLDKLKAAAPAAVAELRSELSDSKGANVRDLVAARLRGLSDQLPGELKGMELTADSGYEQRENPYPPPEYICVWNFPTTASVETDGDYEFQVGIQVECPEC